MYGLILHLNFLHNHVLVAYCVWDGFKGCFSTVFDIQYTIVNGEPTFSPYCLSTMGLVDCSLGGCNVS